MLKAPPRHRVDATPVLVLHHGLEPAWDVERIDAELAEAAAENERRDEADHDPNDRIPLDSHPYAVYMRGDTRMDIEAELPWRGKRVTAASYLKPDCTPLRFILRRLRWDEYYRVLGLAATSKYDAQLRACQYGLVEAENGRKVGLKIDPERAERSDAEMQALFELNAGLPVLIGNAVIEASKPLTDSEKKV